MTREHAKKLLPIITAFANGEELQFKTITITGSQRWGSSENPYFEADPSSYRIAPKPRKVWANEYPHGQFSTWPTKKDADFNATVDRIACHEIELPPLP